MVRIERQLDKLAERERKLHEQLAAVAADYIKAEELDVELRALQQERQALEESWIIAADRAGG
jgi:ATP-binding cassette subfamily F protein uup